MKNNVIMKTDTTENWKKAEQKYIPAPFTIIVYQDENLPPKIKISDGITVLGDLPFVESLPASNIAQRHQVSNGILRL